MAVVVCPLCEKSVEKGDLTVPIHEFSGHILTTGAVPEGMIHLECFVVMDEALRRLKP